MAARLFRSERKFKLPAHWQLDPHSDCYRRHTHHITPPWVCVNRSRFDDLTGSVEADEVFVSKNRKAICHPVD